MIDTLPEFYRERISIEGECWIWTGQMKCGRPYASPGYGAYRSVRREMWCAQRGREWPAGQVAAVGSCKNPACVRHAIPVKLGRQIKLAIDRGAIVFDAARCARVTVARRLRAKLDMDKAREIRRRVIFGDESRRAMAAEYDVSPGAINAIIAGRTWREPSSTISGMMQQLRRAQAA